MYSLVFRARESLQLPLIAQGNRGVLFHKKQVFSPLYLSSFAER